MASHMDTTSATPQCGPIIGQILKHSPSNSCYDNQGSSEATGAPGSGFVPFQFQHPFTGDHGVAMVTSGSIDSMSTESGKIKVAEANVVGLNTSVTMTTKVTLSENPIMETQSLSAAESSQESLHYINGKMMMSSEGPVVISIGSDSDGNEDSGTVQAQIVRIDPDVFSREQSKLSEQASGSDVQLVSENEDYTVYQSSGPGVEHWSPITCSSSASGSHGQSPNTRCTQTDQARQQQLSKYSQSQDTRTLQSHDSRQDAVRESEGKYHCSICGASFPESHLLILHGNVHLLQSSRIKCEKCSLRFRSHSGYVYHLKNFHTEGDEASDSRPYECGPCSTAFTSKGHLNKHWRSRGHFMTLETLGFLESGTWEQVKNKIGQLDTTSEGLFMESVNNIIRDAEAIELGEQKVIVESVVSDFEHSSDNSAMFGLSAVVAKETDQGESSELEGEGRLLLETGDQGRQCVDQTIQGRQLEDQMNQEEQHADQDDDGRQLEDQGDQMYQCSACELAFANEKLFKVGESFMLQAVFL